MPERIDEGIVYISLNYRTIIHKCASGCGEEVNTPLHQSSWKLIFNGESISLSPSIGNWNFDCKSHYWITENKVKWSKKWDSSKIQSIRAQENLERKNYFSSKEVKSDSKKKKNSWLSKILFWK
jgi:hypothetical protein